MADSMPAASLWNNLGLAKKDGSTPLVAPQSEGARVPAGGGGGAPWDKDPNYRTNLRTGADMLGAGLAGMLGITGGESVPAIPPIPTDPDDYDGL